MRLLGGFARQELFGRIDLENSLQGLQEANTRPGAGESHWRARKIPREFSCYEQDTAREERNDRRKARQDNRIRAVPRSTASADEQIQVLQVSIDNEFLRETDAEESAAMYLSRGLAAVAGNLGVLFDDRSADDAQQLSHNAEGLSLRGMWNLFRKLELISSHARDSQASHMPVLSWYVRPGGEAVVPSRQKAQRPGNVVHLSRGLLQRLQGLVLPHLLHVRESIFRDGQFLQSLLHTGAKISQ